jgi:hypothetical protein
VRKLPKLNAVDAISPAATLTRANLFNPFRWGFWVRVAVLGLLTGEMSSGGCNFQMPTGWNRPRHDQFLSTQPALPHIPHLDPHVLLAILPIVVGTIVILALIFMYIASVCQFVLLEGVLNGAVSIRDSWTRWQGQGTRYFTFRLLFNLVFLAIVGSGALILLITLGVAGWAHTGGPPPSAIAGLIVGGLLLFLLALPFILVQLLAKDFAVPVMAMEGTTFGTAWRRVWAIVTTDPWNVAGYVGMKIVLSIAVAIMFGIITIIALLVIAVPTGIVGVVAVLIGKAVGLGIGPLTITLIVGAGTILIALIIFVVALIHAPVAIFFPAYGLYFLAGRYQPLHDRLFPPPPPEPIQAPPIPEPPPEPLAT